MKTLIVEGWRFIPHSYAVVSQQLCLEFLERPAIRLLHADHLTELIARAITDGDFRRRATAAGPRWVEEHFTWRHAVDRLLPVLLG